MKKFIVLSLVLGVLGSSSLILKDLTADDNLSAKIFSMNKWQKHQQNIPLI